MPHTEDVESGLLAELRKIAQYHPIPLRVVSYSFGTRIALRLAARDPDLICRYPFLCIAPDGFCPNRWYRFLTHPFIFPFAAQLVRVEFIVQKLPTLLSFWGFPGWVTKRFLATFHPKDILGIWRYWCKLPVRKIEALLKDQMRVSCLTGASDPLFKVACLRKWQARFPCSFQLSVIRNAGHLIRSEDVQKTALQWLASGEHNLNKNNDIEPKDGEEVPKNCG